MKLEATLVKKGCRHHLKGILTVEWFNSVESDNVWLDIGQCSRCKKIVAKISDGGRYYTLKINEQE